MPAKSPEALARKYARRKERRQVRHQFHRIQGVQFSDDCGTCRAQRNNARARYERRVIVPQHCDCGAEIFRKRGRPRIRCDECHKQYQQFIEAKRLNRQITKQKCLQDRAWQRPKCALPLCDYPVTGKRKCYCSQECQDEASRRRKRTEKYKDQASARYYRRHIKMRSAQLAAQELVPELASIVPVRSKKTLPVIVDLPFESANDWAMRALTALANRRDDRAEVRFANSRCIICKVVSLDWDQRCYCSAKCVAQGKKDRAARSYRRMKAISDAVESIIGPKR